MTAELAVGQGKVIFNQVEVCGRVPSEPLAMEYITGVVKYLCDEREGVR